MVARFSASESVLIPVEHQPLPVGQYLRHPERLVYAIADPQQVESLGTGRYRLKMRPRSFFQFTIQPMVDLQVWTDAEGVLRLQSVGCEIRGVEYIDRRFNLSLVGYLKPITQGEVTQLRGWADLRVEVELPPPLNLMPPPLTEAAGHSLLASVLMLIKQRLCHQLLQDYRQWVQSITQEASLPETDTLAWET